MDASTAISIENVTKEYRLGAIGGGTLKGDLQSWWAHFRGKEDPNAIIGAKTAVNKHERFLALDDVSFSVEQGEALGIIGHNGAGKSTLLKLLSRVTAPSKGKICFRGRIASMLEVGTGFHPELTGRENVYMNGAILGMSKKDITKKFDDIISFAEMEKFVDTPVKRYSSGMYVKLAFAVASHLDSEIMIMDEVLAVGDMNFQKKCLDKMHDEARQRGRTILYVSHNMNTIRQLCERCIVLERGRLSFDGNPEQAISRYMGKIINTQNNFDLSHVTHKRSSPDIDLTWTHIHLNQTQLSELKSGEKLQCTLSYRSSKRIENIWVRYEIITMEGSVIASASTNRSITIENTELGEVSIIFNTIGLMPGRYYIYVVAFQCDDYGNEILISGAYPGFSLALKENEWNGTRIIWKNQYWGNIRLSDMQVN